MKRISFLLIVLFTGHVFAQVDRVEINGKVLTSSKEPVEGITIFNLDNLEGTITNSNGVFKINARAGDQLNFDAIQFVPFTLTVSDKVTKDQQAIITLNEGINELDPITLRNTISVPVKRDGSVDLELNKIDTKLLKIRSVDRMSNTFSDKVRQPEDYPVQHLAAGQSGLRMNSIGLNGSGLADLLSSIFSSAKPKAKFNASILSKKEFDILLIKDKYTADFLTEFLKLEQEYLYEFLYFAKDNSGKKQLMHPEQELDLLQYLSEQVVVFKKRKGFIF